MTYKKRIEEGVSGSALMNQANERMEEVLSAPETASPVVHTTVVNNGVTLGVNVQLPEDYHLRLTMYNKRNHKGGIKHIATNVVMDWIDKNCPAV